MNNDKLLKNAQHLFEVCHKTKPLVLLQSGSNGYFLSMEFQTLDDGQAVHSAMVEFLNNQKTWRFEILLCGGKIDDPWVQTIEREGPDMQTVLKQVTEEISATNVTIISISQMD